MPEDLQVSQQPESSHPIPMRRKNSKWDRSRLRTILAKKPPK